MAVFIVKMCLLLALGHTQRITAGDGEPDGSRVGDGAGGTRRRGRQSPPPPPAPAVVHAEVWEPANEWLVELKTAGSVPS